MMACGLSKSLGLLSSLKMKQGIVTILGGGDGGGGGSSSSTTPSLKRTFSADLSSKNWLSQNEFSPMKRISSSEKLRAFDSLTSREAEEGSRSGFDIWTKIQQDKNNNNKEQEEEEIVPEQSDVWSSILSAKKSNDDVPPPYVHPLMKRASSLSEKSLKICTESLGSETGCETFSSSETEDDETDKEETTLFLNVIKTEEEETESEVEVEQESITVPDHTTCDDLPRGSFPPPIRSLSSQSGTSLQMKTRRDNGRLVLEAVSVPSQNNFSANRENGRLLLTFAEINNGVDIAGQNEDEIDSEIQWLFDEQEEEAKDEFAYKRNGLMYKLSQKPIGPITVHRLAHKPIGIPKRNSRWPPTDENETATPVVHSLPPSPRVAQLARSTKPPSTVDDTVGAACFNTCDYYWKPTYTEALGLNKKAQSQAQNIVNKSINVGLESWINGCKERRRSLLSIEPYCIATS